MATFLNIYLSARRAICQERALTQATPCQELLTNRSDSAGWSAARRVMAKGITISIDQRLVVKSAGIR
jgi:hypothetical protein